MSIGWSPISPRAWLYSHRLSTYPSLPIKETIVKDEKIKTLASLFLEAYTYFMNIEYKRALVIR